MTRYLVFVLLGLLLVSPAFAAEPPQKENYTATLLALNRTRPAQNPNFAMGKEILNRRLIDKNQRTLGKVEDIILNSDGKFASITTTVDTSGFRQEIGFDVASYIVDPTRDTFMVNMDKAQIKASLPKLLAEIETSAGDSAPITIDSLRKGEVRRADRSIVAQISDVMVNDRTKQVEALLVVIANGAHRGSTIAIPYEAWSLKREGDKAIVTVGNAEADTMILMALNR